jgi:hypothetical protein
MIKFYVTYTVGPTPSFRHKREWFGIYNEDINNNDAILEIGPFEDCRPKFPLFRGPL